MHHLVHRDGNTAAVRFDDAAVFFRLVASKHDIEHCDLYAVHYPSAYLLDRINALAPAHKAKALSVLLYERHGETLVSIFLRGPDDDWDETVEIFVGVETPGEGASVRIPLTLFKALLNGAVPREPQTVPVTE